MTPQRRVKVLFYRLFQQNHRCFYCACDLTLEANEPSLDHVTPRSSSWVEKARLDEPRNCVASCLRCNNKKAARMPTDDETRRLAALNKSYTDQAADAHFFDMLRTPIHIVQAARKCGIKA